VGQRLIALKTRRARSVPLALAHAFDPGTIDLAVIARRVEEKGNGDCSHRRWPQTRERQTCINEDQEHQRRNGAKEINCCHRRPPRNAQTRKRHDRAGKTPDQAERNNENTNKNGLPEAGKDERQRSLHDRQIEELLNDRFHHTLRQANRVSSRRPSTTTGMNRITYAIAPIMSGVALSENDCAVVAWLRISPTPITVPSAVFLVMAIVRFVSGGTVKRIACGSTMKASVARKPKPVERAASH